MFVFGGISRMFFLRKSLFWVQRYELFFENEVLFMIWMQYLRKFNGLGKNFIFCVKSLIRIFLGTFSVEKETNCRIFGIFANLCEILI